MSTGRPPGRRPRPERATKAGRGVLVGAVLGVLDQRRERNQLGIDQRIIATRDGRQSIGQTLLVDALDAGRDVDLPVGPLLIVVVGIGFLLPVLAIALFGRRIAKS